MGTLFKGNYDSLYCGKIGLKMKKKIAFMQGRLTPVTNDIIQEFPWDNWQNEIQLAATNKFSNMEWTIDRKNIQDNPIFNYIGRQKIKEISLLAPIKIETLTADCCMQSPFWKINQQEERMNEIDIFKQLIAACSEVGIHTLVLPVVDNGSLTTKESEVVLKSTLQEIDEELTNYNVKIAMETDLDPDDNLRLLEGLSFERIGINYDIGNSASIGFSPEEEWEAYGKSVFNLHVKDRKLNGTTVRLGCGDADFGAVKEAAQKHNYTGNWVLQTARANRNDDLNELLLNLKFVEDHLL
jgi:L-ribulose-5-phosphate 3-epimerase